MGLNPSESEAGATSFTHLNMHPENKPMTPPPHPPTHPTANPAAHIDQPKLAQPKLAKSALANEELQPLCPYCNAGSSFLTASTDRNRHTNEEVFQYFTCNQCQLIFMDPQPADMSPYYKGGYGAIPASTEELNRICRAELYRVEPIFKRVTSGRYLEIGPWRGIMCNNMKQAGFEVTAIELDSACIEYLRDTLGVHAIQSGDPAAAMKALTPGFDVIASWHSLEHIPHPWRFVEEAAKLLRPGGILLISMPNPQSYEFSVMKAGWMHLDAPRHLHLYPLPILESLCAANGLRLLQSTTSDSFSRLLTRQAWYQWVYRAIPIPLVNSIAASILGRILRFQAKLRRRASTGSSYTAMFVKE